MVRRTNNQENNNHGYYDGNKWSVKRKKKYIPYAKIETKNNKVKGRKNISKNLSMKAVWYEKHMSN